MKTRQELAEGKAGGCTGTCGRGGERGFTLLEMTIVLVIVGLLIGMTAPLLGQILDNNRTSATIAHMDTIENALTVFVRANGRLPCPAQPDAATLGVEEASCNGADAEGIVPFRTLGLAEGVARDGYNNFMTYHVAEEYADSGLNSDIALGFCLENASLTVNDENGSDLAPGLEVAYVLVSHGENGFGFYSPPNANRVNAASGGPFEDENADDDDTFVATTPIDSDGTNGPYDDTVTWGTRDGIADRVQEFGCP